MKSRVTLIVVGVLMAVGLLAVPASAETTAADEPPVVLPAPCVTDNTSLDDYTVTGRGRSLTHRWTDVNVTAIYDTAESLTVHYQIEVRVETPYALGRPPAKVTVYDGVCYQAKGQPAPDPDPDPGSGGRDPYCGSPDRCDMLRTIRENHARAIERARGAAIDGLQVAAIQWR